MKVTSPAFQAKAAAALHDATLQKALKNVETGFVYKRAKRSEEHTSEL